MRTAFFLGLLTSLLVSASCRTLKNEVDIDALLKDRGDEAFVSGPVRGLGAPVVHNRKDFIYAFSFDRAGENIAFTHHVTTHMELSIAATLAREPGGSTQVNANEFDLEGVAFVDGRESKGVVVASRQGTLRRFTRAGVLEHELSFGIALTRVAVSPGQALIAAGTADGRVVLFDAANLAFRGVARPHKAEVRGLAFVSDQQLVSVGFDKELVVHTLEPGGAGEVRLASTDAGQGMRVFLAHLEGRRAVPTSRDQRQPISVVSSAAVKRLGLETVAGKTANVVTPVGPQPRPVVKVDDLQVRYVALGELEAAVCDECIPPGVEIVLGQDALARATFGDDIAAGDVMVKIPESVSEGVVPAQRIPGAIALGEKLRVTLPGPATDISLARTGPALVSYSHAKAERSTDVYEAEKEDRLPPPGPASAAVLVDLESGELGRRYVGHRGFTFAGAISPDGKTVATGGWDNRVLVFDAATGTLITERELGWIVRQLRFSRDGRFLGVAAWTRPNPVNDGASDPAMIVYPVVFQDPEARSGARAR